MMVLAVMDANVFRDRLLGTLPISREPLLLRGCERPDMDLLAAWPNYPPPHDVFVFSFARLTPTEMDSRYNDRLRQEDRITLVADWGSDKAVGYLALLEIRWERRESHNLGIRVHPEWCGRGIGAEMLVAARDWWFESGMKLLRLDVASSNSRAVRCYEKVGFVRRGEFWQEAPDLAEADLAHPRWRFLEGHVRTGARAPELRFLVMELRSSSHAQEEY